MGKTFKDSRHFQDDPDWHKTNKAKKIARKLRKERNKKDVIAKILETGILE